MSAMKPGYSHIRISYAGRSSEHDSDIYIPTRFADHMLLNRLCEETAHSCPLTTCPKDTSSWVTFATLGLSDKRQKVVRGIMRNEEDTYGADNNIAGIESVVLTMGTGSEYLDPTIKVTLYKQVNGKVSSLEEMTSGEEDVGIWKKISVRHNSKSTTD